MIRRLKRLLAWWSKPRCPAAEDFEVRQFTPQELREFAIVGAMSNGASRENAERFLAHLTGERVLSEQERIRMILNREPRFVHAAEPIVTDWDVALAVEQPEPEPGRIEYRFLGVTGEEDV